MELLPLSSAAVASISPHTSHHGFKLRRQAKTLPFCVSEFIILHVLQPPLVVRLIKGLSRVVGQSPVSPVASRPTNLSLSSLQT